MLLGTKKAAELDMRTFSHTIKLQYTVRRIIATHRSFTNRYCQATFHLIEIRAQR
jgi:hypothetical protein